jgi:ABC-type lipoprotein export system ATPase subunit
MKKQELSTNQDLITSQNLTTNYSSYLPRVTLTQGLNIYSAYNSFGAEYAVDLACASLGDGYFSTKFEGRNYLSLSVFWGNIAYKAINQVQNSNFVPYIYKGPLNVLFTIAAAGMVWKGKDIFEEKHDLATTAKAVKLTAGFFDEQGTISTLESEFNKGYLSGLVYGFKNAAALITNKFVSYTIIGQVLYFVNSFLVQKVFGSGQLKNDKGVEDVIKDSFTYFCQSMVEFVYGKISGKVSGSVKNEIDQKVAKIALEEGNGETIVKLGDAINQFSGDVNAASSLASSGFSSLNNALFFNQLFGLKTHAGESFYNKYPTLVLSEAITRKLFAGENIMEIKAYLEKMLYGEPVALGQAEGTETTTTKIGTCTVNIISNSKDYTYQNIQEIAKLGGNRFMLDKVIKFLENPNNQGLPGGQGNDFLSIMLTTIQNLISNIAFAAQLPALQLSDNDLQDVLGKLMDLTNLFGTAGHLGLGAYQTGDIDRAISTLNSLKNPESNGVTRALSKDFTLSLKNYHLKKVAETKDMIHIPEINLTSGKVYAISGVIGTGKTTLLTDVAKCMISAFSSSGSIEYPVYHDEKGQHEVPIIFCGTVPFSPPATTLLERVTYRMPAEYRLEHKDELLSRAMELFKAFGQDGFNQEKFIKVGNNDKIGLSTGQGKLVILVAAILYKQYLNSPALFVIDETLANLDIGTSSAVCKKIKEVFSDSLVLSVDHNYIYNTAFYNTEDVLDLSQYRSADEVVVSGEGSAD